MTPTNAARDALERLASDARFGIASDDYEHARPDEYHQQQQRLQADYKTILTILERLEVVDRAALREAVSRIKKGYAQFDKFGTSYAVLHSERNENDLNLIEEAARIIADMGE